MAKENLNDEDELDGKPEPEKAPKKKLTRKKMIIAVSIVLLIGVGVGVAWFLLKSKHSDEPTSEGESATSPAKADGKKSEKDVKDKNAKKPKAPKGPPVYFAFDSPFTVNYEAQGSIHFLQITVEVMMRDPLVVEQLKGHLPQIRDRLVMLFSGQSYESISTRVGKEKIRADALIEIQKVLEQETGKPGIEAVYFTSFVTQ